MTPEQMVEVRPRLLEFAGQMFAGALPRSDQRIKGELYLRGLLTDGRRKSMQPMAERLGADYQGLQQFVTSSTWDFEAGPGHGAPGGGEGSGPPAAGGGGTGVPKEWKGPALVAP